MKPAAKKFELKPPQILVLGFAAIILIGSILLSLPVASASGQPTPFLDALFTATSATCVTGLVVVDTGTHWSVFGQIVIILLIQVGGLGFMTMATLFAFVLKKRISLKERLILQEAMNQGSMEGIVRLIRKVIRYSLTIEAIAAVIFSIRWSFDLGVSRGIYYGIFHAISFFNNAGFDLFGSVTGKFSSLTAYADDWVINLVSMMLIILGGLGFVVISDLIEFKTVKKLSLHSKVVLSATGILIGVGTIVIFVFELTNMKTLGPLSWSGKFLASLFQSVSPRTAGANSVDIAGLRQATQFFIIILMFIGASPGSTGGGIKTTTFTTLVGAIVAMIRGKEDIVLFHYRLGKDRILKAITLTMIALFLVIFVTMLLSTTEDHSFLMILFEVTSAFGTVGLSMGLTPDLTEFGKVMIALTMFAGRLGPLTLAYALGPKAEKELYRYPEGKITIG
ncbi:TrkH family potassium uptake protein [Paenibacillus mucilaginosus]|uniref:Potassium uptake protein, TrkH family n=2 Tax=Paenibacillus mucilaginosus TaxID=61624 RepID=H6NED7_9BACL|nr:TrkH family potassium uptake protein [Paenibacillus mucilaginosus]AEI42292.1 potassium uptake protein, TrkH family [Paenibacillus mucilaginosus KNP414]AFC28080.1 potassium uptake protein, TrkH family [Paenibacillus mucilaginosus 3016]MCG7214252.1 TrkH family potassium uptake protein [Paenibacillus mucilaginosus]WDM28764.1 TrkH family potassium uptake protein [Paenibacillus mucilaginosus]WFA16928.1 Trk family potassium uptake protein [Paenibacillus mucilaginosus]